MRFRTAVQSTTEIALHFQRQLNALSRAHQNSIRPSDPRRITGSVDIDAALRLVYPRGNRWDYAIGYRITSRDDKAFFVEFHKAIVDEVDRVIQKKEWLENWMNGKPVASLQQKKFVWVASGGVNIPQGSPQRRSLNAKGLTLVRRLKLK